MSKFPDSINAFASTFVELHDRRHDADYNPYEKFTKSGVLNDILKAEQVIKDFIDASAKDRRAFAAWVLFRKITNKGK